LQRVLTTVTLLGLLVATAAAFAITEHLKLIKSPVYGTQVSKVLSPVCHCATDKATIQIRLRRRDDVTVTIVNSGGDTVATIAAGAHELPHQPYTFVWHGRTDAGTLVPDGVYHPWVQLANARRTFRFPNKITVDTQAPKVLSASGRPPVLFVAPRDKLAIRYVFSEPAHAVVYLGHQRILLGRRTRPHGKVEWGARLGGKPLRAGRYVLSVGAVDLAGNETPAAQRKNVTVVFRYIEVAPRVVRVRAGAQFKVHVETNAPRYTWRLDGRRGARSGKILRLRAPTKRGTYRLFVTEQGHATSVLVKVRAR
jgi:flagellar hook capping protein FlgD